MSTTKALFSTLKRLRLQHSIPLLLLAACAAPGGDDDPNASTSEGIIPIGIIRNPIPIGPIQVLPRDPQFTIRALGKMCLDVGGQAYWAPGAPVTLYWCNGSVAQQLGVREVAGAGHDVNLVVGSSFCVGIRGGIPVAGAALELQTCNGSPAQQFALDGDSIMAGSSSKPTTEAILVKGIGIGTLPLPVYPVHRSFVWKPQNDVTGAKTPMVLGTREVTENEYLRFYAVDGSNTPPHSGFVRPTDGPSLIAALQAASWGTVVELADGVYDVTGTTGTQVHQGVTLRGYRKLTDNGPQITFNQDIGNAVFGLSADDVRVTGLRLQGPTDSTDTGVQIGIDINDGYRVLVDHIEASRFPVTAVAVHGWYTNKETTCDANPGGIPVAPRQTYVNVARNFIHHNEGSEKGYGVSSTKGAFAVIEGNTEYMNRHNITSDYQPESGYIANNNLVLSNYPTYYDGFQSLWDFDVHGSDPGILGTTFDGGIAGDYVLIQYNTFLASRTNINVRGVPCGTAGLIDGNIFLHPMGSATQSQPGPSVWIPDAVKTLDFDGTPVQVPTNLTITANNGFNVEDPTNHLGTGDFDGDGIDDVFLGTGNGWFYSSGGAAEWRFLRRMTERAQDVLIGDIDGDGRADVVRVGKGGSLDVSWGGVSNWQFLTSTPSAQPISSYVIGNFDGDRLHGDDIFTSSGGLWLVAPSGRNFATVGSSSFPMKDLRFGDFTGDGITDVFAIAGGAWSISKSATNVWTPLGGPSSDNLDGYFVADFDGNGIADVAYVDSGILSSSIRVSFGGTSPLDTRRNDIGTVAAIGRFEGGAAQTLVWNDHQFVIRDLASNGHISRQDMR